MSEWLYYLIPLIFIAVVIYVLRPWAKKRYDQDANIPFQHDDEHIPKE